MTRSLEEVARSFRHMVEVCGDDSPLYAALSRHVTEDHELLRLAAHGAPRQPPPNLLFGAVHDLLLGGVDHPLAGFYPSVGGERPAELAPPVFGAFCHEHADAIAERVATRRVQTNEVGRCGPLLLAFARVADRFPGRPLALFELGCSAGLTLGLARYRYEFGRDHVVGPASPATVRTALLGDARPPLPREIPAVAGRTGVDLHPVDVTDAREIRWVEALLWPDVLPRVELFRAAVELARADPPRLVAGDGLDVLPDLVAATPAGALPVVHHSHATYQMDRDWQARFATRIDELGSERDLAHVSLEWLGDDPGPRLHLTTFRSGERRHVHLADVHHHGKWVRWRGRDGR